MRYHPFFKALCLIFAALALVAAVLCVIGAAFLLNANLYEMDFDSFLESIYSYRAEHLSATLLNRYAQLTYAPDSVPPWDRIPTDEVLSEEVGLTQGCWSYTICSTDNIMLESTAPEDTEGLACYSFVSSSPYWVDTDVKSDAYFMDGDQYRYMKHEYSPIYQISIFLSDGAITAVYGLSLSHLYTFHSFRYWILILFVGLLLVFLLCAAYLFVSAGRGKKADPVCPRGLNRLPLDLYLAGAGLICWAAVMLSGNSLFYDLFSWQGNRQASLLWLELLFIAGLFFLVALTGLAFLFALTAQWKAPDRFWWKNTLIFRVFSWLLRHLRQGCRKLLQLMAQLPLMWQWLVTGLGMFLVLVFGFFLSAEANTFFFLILAVLADFAVILYGAWAFGCLMRGAAEMAQGELERKIETHRLFCAFRTVANNLNALAEVTREMAKKQLQSERMKTELITNVSHDIKTPLTSIINYTDLLRTATDPQEREEYTQILERQSLRLKRLIEDLTELSRASTGNIQPELTAMDATEALKQALGEFSDKITMAQLQLCTKIPEKPVIIQADGRLFWRVAANLTGNVVKYAQPGTRFYVELTQTQNKVIISFKNISREPLNISTQELKERFVRGDASRNTEGSGLGLSIAASLMEVQKGQLRLQTDADLFTAAMEFPLV